MRLFSACLILALLGCASATVFFKEEFGSGWEKRWVLSQWKKSEGTQGKFGVSAGKFYGDAEKDKGLQTQEDARFYGITAQFPEFSNEGKDFVVQFSVKHEQNIDCGGGYVKILPAGVDVKKFGGDTKYNIMFGPDICGTSTRKTHVIFNYDGKNLDCKKSVRAESDQFTHLYTLLVRPDNTYEVFIDQASVESGKLHEDWDFLPPKTIPDPSASKPADWVDEAMIPDPEDQKPEGYDDVPAQIADPSATMPDDWDEELDGKWEAPMIDNPEFKGEWKPRMIANPAYKGPWEHPMIPNPEYKENNELYKYPSFAHIGFDLWQVKSGTIFDNILITDSLEEAKEFAEKTWAVTKDAEREMYNKQQEEERKMQEAAAAAAKSNSDDDEEEDDDEERRHDDL
eukprot:GILI01001233.1.p1 GENE.GILI01001233.1~~GILI01001233.1.p1  ORF type:complete len:408 (-),score=171.80 GILI01001233.1:83-1279(-)